MLLTVVLLMVVGVVALHTVAIAREVRQSSGGHADDFRAAADFASAGKIARLSSRSTISLAAATRTICLQQQKEQRPMHSCVYQTPTQALAVVPRKCLG